MSEQEIIRLLAEEIACLRDKLNSAKSSSDLWYKVAQQHEVTIADLKNKLAEAGDNV